MTTKETEKTSSKLRPAQVFASALAATTGAFIAAKLGVYGTVAGAAIFSIMVTVGSEMYLRSLDKTKQAAKVAREAAVSAKATALARSGRIPWSRRTGAALPNATAELRTQSPDATTELDAQSPDTTAALDTQASDADVAETDEIDDGSAVEEAPPADDSPWRRVHWKLVAAISVAAFVLGMVAVTGVELLKGSPLSGGDGTSVSGFFKGKQNPDQQPEEQPLPSPTEAPIETTTPVETTTPAETTTPVETTAPDDEAEPDEPAEEEPEEEVPGIPDGGGDDGGNPAPPGGGDDGSQGTP